MRSPFTARSARNRRGYSVIEALIAISLLGVVMLVGLPNLRRAQISTKSGQALRRVVTVFDVARAEAVKRHSPVAVTVRSGAPQVVVYEDWIPSNPTAATNGNGVYDYPVEEALLSVQFDQAVAPVHPTGAAAVQLGAGASVVFLPDGSPRFGSGAPSSPAVYLRDRWGNHFRVRVNGWTGRVVGEQYQGGTSWTAETSRWTWKY